VQGKARRTEETIQQICPEGQRVINLQVCSLMNDFSEKTNREKNFLKLPRLKKQ
jgi:hypothetical protein